MDPIVLTILTIFALAVLFLLRQLYFNPKAARKQREERLDEIRLTKSMDTLSEQVRVYGLLSYHANSILKETRYELFDNHAVGKINGIIKANPHSIEKDTIKQHEPIKPFFTSTRTELKEEVKTFLNHINIIYEELQEKYREIANKLEPQTTNNRTPNNTTTTTANNTQP